MMTWMPVATADVFYDLRLKAGHDALTARRWLEATEALRIACFGLLDTPKSLTPCLAMLSLAQNGLGRTADVDTTLARIVEVESRFAVYDPSALDPDLRPKFESLIGQRVARSTLLGIPTLARIVDPNAGKKAAEASRTTTTTTTTTTTAVASVPTSSAPATTQPMTSAPAQSQPAPVPTTPAYTTPSTSSTTAVPPPTTPARTTATPASTVSTPAATASRTTALDSIERAKRLLAEGKADEAKPFLVSAVSRDPGRRELRLLLLQAAVLSSDWQTALQQLPLAQPFADTEAAAMFYASVALFESRREEEARELMTRALPRLAPSAYVDTYAKKILPQ
jgi:hypothetical protein